MTTVVKLTKANRAEMIANPSFVWVGRASGRLGMRASPWGNPYRPYSTANAALSAIDTQDAVTRYARWIMDKITTAQLDPRELRDKVLGCACGDWQPGGPDLHCHAVLLAKIADGSLGEAR